MDDPYRRRVDLVSSERSSQALDRLFGTLGQAVRMFVVTSGAIAFPDGKCGVSIRIPPVDEKIVFDGSFPRLLVLASFVSDQDRDLSRVARAERAEVGVSRVIPTTTFASVQRMTLENLSLRLEIQFPAYAQHAMEGRVLARLRFYRIDHGVSSHACAVAQGFRIAQVNGSETLVATTSTLDMAAVEGRVLP